MTPWRPASSTPHAEQRTPSMIIAAEITDAALAGKYMATGALGDDPRGT
ncbi:MAG: hypothetical protein IPK19_13235 [Chloroflexi bacterium]|nr:hypothetical protein [Chloroflexota bacterium]